MSSEEKDIQAKEAARASARARKPGAVSVAAEEAARLDQRIADKREKAEGSLKPAPDSEVEAKQRGVRLSSTPTKPGAYAEVAASPASQLESFQRDVAAKVRSSGAATQPGAHPATSDAVEAKVSRSAPGPKASGGPAEELAQLESAVVGKVRSAPAATTPGAASSLQGLEDSIAAKVRRNDAAVAPGVQAHLQTMEDSVAAKIRRDADAKATGAPARLQAMEDSVAAKVRCSTAAAAPAGARTELGNLEDSVANKIRGAGSTSAGMLAESHSAQAMVSAKVSGTDATGALRELQGLESAVASKSGAQRISPVEADLNEFENAVRSKENIGIHNDDPAKSLVGASDGLDKIKMESHPEQALDKDDDLTQQGRPEVITSADHGIATSPDLEYGMMGAGAGEGLAVAVAVEEEEDDMFIPSAVEYDPDAKPPLYKNRRFRLYAFLAFFIIVVVVVGATIAATLGKAPTTNIPTPAPTTIREGDGLEPAITREFGEDVLEDPDSPYAKALKWMTFDDPLQLVPSNSSNFIQRYTAVYLYFATTANGPWRSCNPPANPRTDSSACTHLKLSFLFPEQYDLQPSHAWLSNSHECDWAGVLCDDQKQIRSIDLSGGLLTGTFPEGVYNFPFLQELSLYWNNITGPLPTKLTEMNHLVSLELHYNKFTGSVPKEWWQARNLQRINIGENLITGTIPTEVGHLRDIKGFFVMTNLFTGTIPEEIGVLDSVTYFRASRNQLEGPLPSTFTNLKSLGEVWLHRNLLNGSIPEDIGSLDLLADLRLHINPMSGELPESLWDLDLLFRLDLYECNFTGTLSEGVGKLGKGFWELHLSDNMFHGPLPQNISQLSEIYSVWLEGNDFTGTVPQALCDRKGDTISQVLTEFSADCSPDYTGHVELSCPSGCCTICCLPDGTNCLSTLSDP